jgi:hypothetical protein
MDRQIKTASEVEAMIMDRAREHPDCAHVKAVAVRSGEVGWRVVAITTDGRMMSVKPIDDIAHELQAIYDLSDAE